MTKTIQHVSARRWFNQTSGNTFFSCVLHFTDGTEECCAHELYGYDEYYWQHAKEYAALHGYDFVAHPSRSVCDVAKRKSLH